MPVSRLFATPTSIRFVRWEAEQALRHGAWEVLEHPWASGGAYVRRHATDGGAVLEFPFEASERLALRVYPEWWRHGEQQPAKRFPHPLPRTTGPTALASCSNRLFFNAPATGCLGVADVSTETLLEAIHVGGYPVDLVGDGEASRLYVVDAAQSRIVIVDTDSLRVVGEVAVPELPWSASLHEDRLFVACMKGKCLAALDTHTGVVEQTSALSAHPHQVTLLSKAPPTVGVSMLPTILNPATLEEEMPDRFEFHIPSQREQRPDRWQPAGLSLFSQATDFAPRRREAELVLPVRTATWEAVTKRFDSDKNHFVRVQDTSELETHVIAVDDPDLQIQHVREDRGNPTRQVDVSSVTKQGSGSKQLPFPLRDDPGPAAFDTFGTRLLFVSPSSGRIGVLDMEVETLVASLEVGGYLTDLVADASRGKVYVCDALNSQLIVVDAERLEVLRRVAMPATPLSLAMAEDALFVACHGDKCLAIVDREGDFVSQVKPLPAPPLEVHTVRLYPQYTFLEGGRYPWHNAVPPDCDAPERLLVQMAHQRVFNAATLQPVSVEVQDDSSTCRHQAIANGKTFRAEVGAGTLCIDGQRWLDLASIVDPNLCPDSAALGPGDIPGTITFAMDEGPAHDWKRNLWMSPDTELYLQNETDEFWRWNAVTFAVEPGHHVLRVRANSQYACLDGVNVALAPPRGLCVSVHPEPLNTHGQIPFASYQGVFYDTEEVRFTLRVTNQEPYPYDGTLSCEVRNFLDEVVHAREEEVHIAPDSALERPLHLDLEEWGIFHLSVRLKCHTSVKDKGSEVELAEDRFFLRVPKLDHPRLLFRREEMSAVRARVREYPRLFQRYARWLLRHCEDKGFFPSTLLSSFSERGEYLNVLAKWRVLVCQFAAMFVEDLDEIGRACLAGKAASFLERDYADQVTFVHNWFRAALPLLYDLAAADSQEAREAIAQVYGQAWKDLERVEENLLSLREPLTPQMRLDLCQQTKWLLNVDRYFAAHAGKHGGNLYVSHHSLCVCPIFGTLGALMLYRNVLGMTRLFERPYFADWFTHYRQVMPHADTEGFFSHGSVETGGPITGVGCTDVKTLVDAVAMLTRHPLEKHLNAWDKWLAKANAREDFEDARLEEVFAEGIGVCLPIFLALGWYEPGAPETPWEDLPMAALFDGEGEAVMRSGWGENATSLYFACGVRDVVTRHQPGHLQLMKGGKVLLGSPAVRKGDHAQPVPSWGNVVAVGKEWPQRWIRATGHPRGMEERLVINRYAPEARVYEARNDAFLKGKLFAPVRYDQCYVLGFSEHVQNPFIKEGEIVGFGTTPEFDYAAGDATNAWPCDQVAEAYRQVVFLKPDTVLVYDRLELVCGEETCWLAAVWRELSVDGKRFHVINGHTALTAQVLLPEEATLCETSTGYYGELVEMPVVEIRPKAVSQRAEYLVAMRASEAEPAELASCDLLVQEQKVGARLEGLEGGVTCLFNRTGAIGGHVLMDLRGKRVDRPLGDFAEG